MWLEEIRKIKAKEGLSSLSQAVEKINLVYVLAIKKQNLIHVGNFSQ